MKPQYRYLIEVPYSVTSHGVATVTIDSESPTTATCIATDLVRAGLKHPVVHEPRILQETEIVHGDA